MDDDNCRVTKLRAKPLSRSCESCKARKSRCDSARPQCGICRRRDVPCEYKEKAQPGLKPGYGKAVERRLTLLESNLETMSQALQDVLVCLQTTQTMPKALKFDNTRSSPSSTGTCAVSDTFTQSSSQQSEPHIHVATFQETCSVLEPAFATPPALVDSIDLDTQYLQAWEAPVTASPSVERNLDPSLPSELVLHELIDLFFKYVYPWAPLFHRQSLKVEAFTPSKQILLHGIVVVADRFWSKPEPTLEVRQAQLKTSKDKIFLSAIDSASISCMQALALLAIDAVGQGPGPRAWNVMSMLVTGARQMQLGRSGVRIPDACDSPLIDHDDTSEDTCSDDGILSNTEAEERRRLFWTIYSLDRLSNMPLGRPSAIDSRFIRLQYPIRDDDWGQPASEWFQLPSPLSPCRVPQEPLNLWHYYIDVLTMVDASNQLLIQPVDLSLPASCEAWQTKFRQLEESMFSWFENLPDEVREKPKEFDPVWTLVHATFYLIIVRTYVVAAFPSTASSYLRPVSTSHYRCRQAVHSIASLAASLEPGQIHRLGPTFVFAIWLAARGLIILWTMGYETADGGTTPKDLEPILRALKESATTWPWAQRHYDVVQMILDTKDTPSGSVGLQLFNDTRHPSYTLQKRLAMLPFKTHALLPGADDGMDFSGFMTPNFDSGVWSGDLSTEWMWA